MSQYLQFTRSAFYALIAALPLLVAYELLLIAGGSPHGGQVRNAGDVWLRMLLASLDVRPSQATLVMILVLVLALPLVKRRAITVKGAYLGLMLLEALGYSLALGLTINVILEFIFSAIPSSILGRLVLTAAAPMEQGTIQGLAMSLGAGLFEEFIFRVVLLGALLFTTRIFLPLPLAAMISIVLASLLFSAAHYIGSLGDPYSFVSFLFRFIAGLLFSALYYARGFAITAYSHAFYNIGVIVF